jgi:VWFA-related protein
MFTLAVSACVVSAQSQDRPADTVRIRTRVVLLDVLVKDKRTNVPVTDLKSKDFEIFDNGRARQLTYFSPSGERTDRPLALVLTLAPIDEGARNSLQNPAILKSFATALASLPPEAEVAVMYSWWGGILPPQSLVTFTRDRSQVATALAKLRSFNPPSPITVGIRSRTHPTLEETLLTVVSERPNSQVAVVMVTDSVYQLTSLERDEMAAGLLRNNVTFNALITGTDKFFLLSYPLLKPASDVLNLSLYGVPRYLAQRTGGEEVRVRKPEEYGAALEQLIRHLSSRYSLGFTLAEGEPDDGRMHQLKVNVTARDARGKKRKLKVITRQSYQVPKTEE